MVACDNAIKTRGHFEKLKIPAAVKACDGHDMSICCKKKIGTKVKHALLNMYLSLNNLRLLPLFLTCAQFLITAQLTSKVCHNPFRSRQRSDCKHIGRKA